MSFFHINRKFLPIKVHYGLFNAGTSTVQPTMPVYSKYLGFSSFVVGTVYTILPILGLFIKPIFGAVADKFKRHRAVLITWEIIILVVYFGIQFIPPEQSASSAVRGWSMCNPPDMPPYLTANFGRTSWDCDIKAMAFENKSISDSFAFTGYNTIIQNQSSHYMQKDTYCTPLTSNYLPKTAPYNVKGCTPITREISDSETFSQWQFWVFLTLLIGAWGGTSVVTTMSDTICIEICGDPLLYGKQRMWGTLGWAVLVVINGFVIDAVSNEGEEKNYTPAFYFMLVPLLLDVVVSYYLKFSIPQQSENIVHDVWRVLLKPRNAIFTFWCAMMGVSLGLVWNFLFWLLEELAADMGSDVNNNIKTIEGLVSFAQCVLGEAPSFFLGGWIVSKIGHGHSLTVIMGAIGIRFILYSLLVDPWWCIPIEFFQCNFGLFYSTMTSYAKVIGEPGTEATIQSILCAVCEGVGVAIGSFLAGYLIDLYGGSFTFLSFGIAFLILSVLNEVVELIYYYMDKQAANNGQFQGVQSESNNSRQDLTTSNNLESSEQSS